MYIGNSIANINHSCHTPGVYERAINLRQLLRNRSVFLFGPRQTGKSTLLHHLFPDAVFFDLLEADTFRELSARPEYMRQTLPPAAKLVVIDEIQKLPALLDEVHLLIERNKELRFVLTGSSARKLKRGGANLLAGRAWIAHLHPLVSAEIGSNEAHLGVRRTLQRLFARGAPSKILTQVPIKGSDSINNFN